MSRPVETTTSAHLEPGTETSPIFDKTELAETDKAITGFIEESGLPPRNTPRIDSKLTSARPGDSINFRIGTTDYQVVRVGEIVSNRGARDNRVPHRDWSQVVEVKVTVAEETRLYRIGKGEEALHAWFAFSYAYTPELGVIDTDDCFGHGWVCEIEDQYRAGD